MSRPIRKSDLAKAMHTRCSVLARIHEYCPSSHISRSDGCVVGAGAVIAEGKTFDDHSLVVGLPAKAIRTLGPEQSATMLGGAQRYVENGRRFKVGLRRIG